jgi:hypothetical protein
VERLCCGLWAFWDTVFREFDELFREFDELFCEFDELLRAPLS